MGTDSKVLERTEEVAKRIAAENPKDFKAKVSVSAQIGSDKDPMKFFIQVYWSFCYNGQPYNTSYSMLARPSLAPSA